MDVFDGKADTWRLDTGNDHILGIGRYYNGEKLLGLFNFGDETETAWVHDTDLYQNLLTGESRDAGAVTMPGCSFVWLYKHF